MVLGDLQRSDCLFKYAKLISADIHLLVEPHLVGAVRQRVIEARLGVEVQAFERHRERLRREAEAYHNICRYLCSISASMSWGWRRPATCGISSESGTG